MLCTTPRACCSQFAACHCACMLSTQTNKIRLGYCVKNLPAFRGQETYLWANSHIANPGHSHTPHHIRSKSRTSTSTASCSNRLCNMQIKIYSKLFLKNSTTGLADPVVEFLHTYTSLSDRRRKHPFSHTPNAHTLCPAARNTQQSLIGSHYLKTKSKRETRQLLSKRFLFLSAAHRGMVYAAPLLVNRDIY